MVWFYRLQQRIAITTQECFAIAVLALLLLLGTGARHLQSQPLPIPPDAYADTERLFAEGTVFLNTRLAAAVDTTEAEAAPAAPVEAPVPVAVAPDAPVAAAVTARMNLNTANASQLERLPRIGPKMAQRILDYRSAHGDFQTVEELVQVKGIGEKTLAKLKPYLFVENE